MEIIPEAFSPLYPRAFIIVIDSLDSSDNMLTNNALYPWRTSVGKDKHSLSIGSAKFKHERNAIMQHQPCHGTMRQSSNYIRSGFLSNLLWVRTGNDGWVPFLECQLTWVHATFLWYSQVSAIASSLCGSVWLYMQPIIDHLLYCLVHKRNGVGPVKPAPCTYITHKRFCFYCGRIRSCMLFPLCLNNNYALLPGYMGGGKSGLVSAIVHVHVSIRVYK